MTVGRRVRFLVSSSIGASATLFGSSAAWADCATSGTTITCTGTTTTGVSTSTPNTNVVVNSGATLNTTGITASGTGSSVDNTGAISITAGSTAISLGGGGTVTQQSAATGAISGNILYADSGALTNRLTNNSTTFGIVGNVTAIGNFTLNNAGLLTTTLTQTRGASGGSVIINNLTGGVISGSIVTAGPTTITNAATISGAINTTAPVTITNSGTITASFTTAPTSGASQLSITNSGTITGNIVNTAGTSAGSVTIGNTGTFTGNVTLNASSVTDSLTITNSGTFGGIIKAPTASLVTITNSGTMGLQGTFTGSVTNSSVFTTGAIPSTATPALLTITGNFSQTSTGTLNLAIASSAGAGAGYGQIRVLGTAALAGTINVTPAQGFYPSGTTFDVVLADQGITNNGFTVTGSRTISPFLTITSNGIVSTSSTMLPNQQALRFTATRAASYATVLAPTATANQLIVARAFQPLTVTAAATPTGDAATLVGAVDYMTIAQAQRFFDQVSAEGYLAYVTAFQDQGALFNRQITMRLDTIGITRDLIGLWIQPYFQRGRTTNKINGSNQNIIGAAAGYDIGTERAKAGIAVGYSTAKLFYNVGNLGGNNDALQVAAYGQLQLGGLKADLQLGYINGSLKTTKLIGLSASGLTAAATAKGNLFKAVGTLAYDLGDANNLIQPYVGVDGAIGSINRFTETGAAAANLTVSKLKADRTDVIAGFSYARKTGSIQPYLQVAYRYNLQNPNSAVTALFNGNSATSFTVNGVVPSRSQQDVNVGIRKKIHDDNSQFFVGYQGTFREGMTSHGANLGLFVTF